MPEDPNQPPQAPAELRDYADRQRERADAAEAALAQAQVAGRENAFLRAGVDIDSPLGSLFARGYDGEPDVDKVREAWQAVAPPAVPPPAEPPDDGPTPAELAHGQAQSALVTGGQPPGEEPSPDPWPHAMATFRGSRERGQTVERAQTAALQEIVNAAVEGDQRVLYDRERWKRSFE